MRAMPYPKALLAALNASQHHKQANNTIQQANGNSGVF
jgi:hypothetical protein